jgi:hypothetical protein
MGEGRREGRVARDLLRLRPLRLGLRVLRVSVVRSVLVVQRRWLLRLQLCVGGGYLAFFLCGHFEVRYLASSLCGHIAVCYLAPSLCGHFAVCYLASLLCGHSAACFFVFDCASAAATSSSGRAATSRSATSPPRCAATTPLSSSGGEAPSLPPATPRSSSAGEQCLRRCCPSSPTRRHHCSSSPARRHCWPSTPTTLRFCPSPSPSTTGVCQLLQRPPCRVRGSDICVIIGLFSSRHSAGGVESRLPPPLPVCKFTGDMFGNGRLLTNPPSFDCFADPRLRRARLDSGEFACLDCLPVCVGGEYWI